MAIDKYRFSQDTAWIQVLEDNTELVLREIPTAISRALERIGILAEGHVVGYMTDNHIVDTGRLRNSISHAVIEGNRVIVGTNVEYAPFVHMGTTTSDPKPFLVDPVQRHDSEYREVLRKELEAG